MRDDNYDVDPDGNPLDFIEDIADSIREMMFPNSDPSDSDYDDY